MTVVNTFDFEQSGMTFRCEVIIDECADMPWEKHGCHGPVLAKTKKGPGELRFNGDFVYDFAAAMKQAKKDGWGCEGTEGMTPGQIAEKAVRADFEYLRSWFNDEWYYVGVVVFPLTANNDELRAKNEALWGIESNATQYIKETAHDLAREIAFNAEFDQLARAAAMMV